MDKIKDSSTLVMDAPNVVAGNKNLIHHLNTKWRMLLMAKCGIMIFGYYKLENNKKMNDSVN